MTDITKTGRVIAIDAEKLQVEMTSCSACSGCAVRSACGLSEMKKKIISVPKPDNHDYQIGDELSMGISIKQGLSAAGYAFGFPLLLLLITVFMTYSYTDNEIISSIFGIIILIPYYFVLFFNRQRLEKKFYCILDK